MLRKTAVVSVIAFVGFLSAVAYADLAVKDGGGVSRTIKNFVCETTKLCNATVLIASDGTEISPATSTLQGTTNTSIGATNESAAGSDTATSGLNGLIKRLLQSITTLNGKIDAITGSKTGGTAATNSELVGCVYNTSAPTLTNGQQAAVQCDVNGNPKVTVVNTLTAVTPGDDITTSTYASASPVIGVPLLWDGTNYDRWKSFGTGIAGVSVQAATTGGCTPGKALSAASTNATNVKNAAGTLCKLIAINTTSTIYYLKTYNTSSTPTCNSDTVVATYPVPPSNGGVAVNLSTFGEAYTTGISFCLTGGLADNDNTNAATGVAISYSYK